MTAGPPGRSAGVRATLSQARSGGARPGSHLVEPTCRGPAGAPGIQGAGGGDCRRGHHQSAGDGDPLGKGHRQAGGECDRLAKPNHVGDLRSAQSRRRGIFDPRENRPGHRSLFFRDENQIPVGSTRRASRAGCAGRGAVRHGGFIFDLAIDRRAAAHHRLLERQPHVDFQYPHLGLG